MCKSRKSVNTGNRAPPILHYNRQYVCRIFTVLGSAGLGWGKSQKIIRWTADIPRQLMCHECWINRWITWCTVPQVSDKVPRGLVNRWISWCTTRLFMYSTDQGSLVSQRCVSTVLHREPCHHYCVRYSILGEGLHSYLTNCWPIIINNGWIKSVCQGTANFATGLVVHSRIRSSARP